MMMTDLKQPSTRTRRRDLVSVGNWPAHRPMALRVSVGKLVLAVSTVTSMIAGAAYAAPELGVRHRLDVAVSAQSGAPLLKESVGAKGSINLTIRLSANSQESRHFGILKPVFSDVMIPDAPGTALVRPETIWEERICHQRRGFPKATVVGLGARFEGGNKPVELAAGFRTIGRPVPSDEIMPAIRIVSDRDRVGPFFVFRSVSKASRLNIDLTLYTIDCFIAAQSLGDLR